MSQRLIDPILHRVETSHTWGFPQFEGGAR